MTTIENTLPPPPGPHNVSQDLQEDGSVKLTCDTCIWKYTATVESFVPAIIARHGLYTGKITVEDYNRVFKKQEALREAAEKEAEAEAEAEPELNPEDFDLEIEDEDDG